MKKLCETVLREALTTPKGPDSVGWQARHLDTVRNRRGVPLYILTMLRAAAQYADEHERRYESPVGHDRILGTQGVLLVLQGARELLNGETGGLDCGTVDAAIVALAEAMGFKESEL